jgi:hypothetical protein
MKHHDRADARTRTNDEPSRRKHYGLRTLDGHATAREVYQALHAPAYAANPDWVASPPAGFETPHVSDTATMHAALRVTAAARTRAADGEGGGAGDSDEVAVTIGAHRPFCTTCGVSQRVPATTRVLVSEEPRQVLWVCEQHVAPALLVAGSVRDASAGGGGS